MATFLGIEIGGTKLQLGVGSGDGTLLALERTDVEPTLGAAGILDSIEHLGSALIQRHDISQIGIGFGGPIDRTSGRVTTSHQIQGWDDFPLVEWCRTQLGLPAVLGNDCDSAALAEARFGAGKGKRRVFYVTVGTGIGGGFVVDDRIVGTDRPAISEIGHLRPGPSHRGPEETVESIASGWGIVGLARQRLEGFIAQSIATARDQVSDADRSQWKEHLSSLKQIGREYEADLLDRCGNDLESLTAKMIAQAADEGNDVGREVLMHATQTLGWAIAQTITLLAPQMVVIGGGVSLMSQRLFWKPIRNAVEQYVFPPLAGQYTVEPAQLGEEVVVHGAVALCAQQ